MFLNKQNISNMKRVKKDNRQKAFWGALIGAGLSAVTNLIGGSIQAKHQQAVAETQYNQQKELLRRQDVQNEYSQKLQNQIAEQQNEGIYEELRKKNYKCGGKVVRRKKAGFGMEDLGSIGSTLITSLGNIGTSIIGNKANDAIAGYQNQLMMDKFNSAKNATLTAATGNVAQNLKDYLGDNFDTNEDVIKRKKMFPNKQLYL